MKYLFLVITGLNLAACASDPSKFQQCYFGITSQQYGNSTELCHPKFGSNEGLLIVNFSNVETGDPTTCTAIAKVNQSGNTTKFTGEIGQCGNGRKLAQIEYVCSSIPNEVITCTNSKSDKKTDFTRTGNSPYQQSCSTKGQCGKCSISCPLGSSPICRKGSYMHDPNNMKAHCVTRAKCHCKDS